MNDNISKDALVIMLSQWLQRKDVQFSDELYYINRSHWWQGYDVYPTFEALQAKIRMETFGELATELMNILVLFG